MLFADPLPELADAELDYQPGWVDAAVADAWLAALVDETPWQQPELFIHGRYHRVPRLTAWYGEPGTAYTYSGLTMEALPWLPVLLEIRERIECVSGAAFNSALLNLYREVQSFLHGPFAIATSGSTDAAEEDDVPAEEAAESRPRGRAAEQVTLKSLDEVVEYFIAAGKKGIAINRYKGLGEMNPDQLWDTTMKPEARTLLQVRAEDHAEADLMFTTLMGDQVEPRRKFIEDNALDVKNLDV